MTTNLTILLLTRSLPLHRSGGLEFHSAQLARGLAAAGADVRVITTRDPHDPAQRGGEIAGGVPVHFLQGGKAGGYSVGTFRAFDRLAQLLAPREGRVIIHAQGFAGFAVRPRRANQRFVVTVHGTLWSETPLWRGHWERMNWSGRAAALWRMKHRLPVVPLWRRMLRRADRLIVDSEFTRRELIAESGGGLARKMSLVPLGVPEENFPQADRAAARGRMMQLAADNSRSEIARLAGAPILLSVGRLHRMKGLHILLDTLAALRERPWRLIIAGDGPERAALESQAAALHLSGRVIFLGRVADEDLPHLYAGADVFVNPELGQPAFGLVALEALLQGTPVIANRAGALPEVVGDNGGALIDLPNAESWRAVLTGWLDQQLWLHHDADALRASALRRFSFQRMIEGTLNAYESSF